MNNPQLRQEFLKRVNSDDIVDGAPTALAAAAKETLTTRLAHLSDAYTLFVWANDPDVRRNSFSPEPIVWEKHLSWLQKKLSSRDCVIFILSLNGLPIGQVRYEYENEKAVLDYSIATDQRGKGFGTTLLKLTLTRALKHLSAETAQAIVKCSNMSSRKALLKAGFSVVREEDRHGVRCWVLETR